ncbi:hypothetical protein LD125_00666 [Mesoplasma sp. JKS002658]|uniref:hypothetical protein n=1 Tax=Mesoplasma whartonense TaxID=2878854 RepID=UPI0020229D90|nr:MULTISPECIES: hypothetical protein [unclassified Mesoplasma]MCL8211614.1 hypothetical protein [Mesoplasma sp. JKS002664]MCL8212353.1 hypothetical protein [Mesoplasma sp. JKS002662]MCL8213501.1 hypothetical protein [Mesoplasma sp. JKS002660]MCL8214402.1 hypothetical protein [Mesoplasma sp. JKS002658]MCL8214983.1 hypothetical protein [Mesoplasma sp. JKS002663]
MNKNQTSDATIQQRSAIFLQIVYSFCELILGFPLFVLGCVALAHPGIWNDVQAGNARDLKVQGSYAAMLVVGILLLVLFAYSVYVLVVMLKERKNQDGVSLKTANLVLGSLNLLGYSLIRESHGIISKRRQHKIAKKQQRETSTSVHN